LEPEGLGRKERQDGPFLTDHPAHEGADDDEPGELRRIRAEPKLWFEAAHAGGA
jgi:hypothetical protein